MKNEDLFERLGGEETPHHKAKKHVADYLDFARHLSDEFSAHFDMGHFDQDIVEKEFRVLLKINDPGVIDSTERVAVLEEYDSRLYRWIELNEGLPPLIHYEASRAEDIATLTV